MAENRDYGQQSYNQDWNQDRERFDRQRSQQQQQASYGDQLKGGYGGSEYGNTYYRADYHDYDQGRVNYIPDNNDNRGYRSNYGSTDFNRQHEQYNQRRQGGYGNQSANYGGGSYGTDYNPGGYGRVGNTGGSFNDSGWQSNRDNEYQRSRTEKPRDDRNENSWLDRATDKVSSWFRDDDDDRNERDREMRGEHRGKGPRGYQRSADRIREDICDRLSDDPFIDASDIEVKIEGNDVILAGTVDSKEAKRRAEDLIESVSGVRNVENRIRVDRDKANRDTRYYTSTDEIGDSSGTTREVIRDRDSANRK